MLKDEWCALNECSGEGAVRGHRRSCKCLSLTNMDGDDALSSRLMKVPVH